MNSKTSFLSLLATAYFLAGCINDSKANVSIRNGNFFIGYTDLTLPGGLEMKIERVYNSKSPFLGMFGWGWGFDFEAYIVTNPDGSIVMHEAGGGAMNIFEPVSFDRTAKSNAVELISSIVIKNNPKSAEDLITYKQKLYNDREFFNEEWEALVKQKKIDPFKVNAGIRLTSVRYGYESILKTDSGYVREKIQTTEYYNSAGKIVEVRNKNGNFIKLRYNNALKLDQMEDDMNRIYKLYINGKDLLDSIAFLGAKIIKSYYRYNDRKEMIFSMDSDGNKYVYGYDVNGRHNMTRIRYSDRTTLDIQYYGRDTMENVKQVKDRDGSYTTYKYESEKMNETESSLSVFVNLLSVEKRSIMKSWYFYFFRIMSNGNEYTYRLRTEIDGSVTDTYYEEANVPSMIIRNTDTTKFRYNAKSMVTYKETNDKITELEYSSPCLKVSKVATRIKNNNTMEWSKFDYDNSCNLVYAQNSDSATCRLEYDNKGRILKMISGKEEVAFEYNAMSKPIKISINNMGSIIVTYASNGEIKKVDSEGGRKVALEVTSKFQNLLELIRPAGVTLSF